MSSGPGIARELSFGEVISKTFELYQRDFTKYLVLFLVVEAVIGLVSTLAYRTFVLPTLPANPTPQQVYDWAPGYFGTLVLLIGSIGIVTLVIGPISTGSAVKMASDEIENRPVELGASVGFAASKLVWMWALGLLVGVIVAIGLFALVVPGIILAIMFCLTLPALLIGNTGVIGSLGRSRELVSRRWLKTFVIFLVLIIVIGIASAVVSAISSPLGEASTLVSSVLSAFYLPILPIGATVYYYSNIARINIPAAGPTAGAPAAIAQGGTKYCPSCGAQLASAATFCSNCGARQPV